MKNKKLLIVLFVIGIFIACNRQEEQKECESPLNPNGDSELALLMRDMAQHLETEKTLLLKGQHQGTYPENFATIRTAKTSASNSTSRNFDNFSLMYLSALKQYHHADSLPKSINAYNNLVKSCVNCHKNECPGPIKRIEKMYIN